MEPFSPHARFFSSLKQVEDRLALEKKNQEPPTTPAETEFETMTKSDFKSDSSPIESDSLSSPIYIVDPNSNSPNSSGLALDFISQTQQTQKENQEDEKNK